MVIHSTVANSTDLVPILSTTWVLFVVNPPTTISWLRKTAAIHSLRGVPMWLMTSQKSVVGLYMWTAEVGSLFESLPPIASSRPWMDTQAVISVTGGAATFLHTLAPLFLKLARNDLQDWRRACMEHVYMWNSLKIYTWSPQSDAGAYDSGWGRSAAVDHWRLSMSITSVCSVDSSFSPPATTKAASVHSIFIPYRFIGMSGNSSVHLLPLPFPVRLNTLLVMVRAPQIRPPTRVRRLLMMTEVQKKVGLPGSWDQLEVLIV